MILKTHHEQTPRVHETAFVAENATLIGDVELGEHASVWFGAVIRGDRDRITIGAYSNVQDNATLHLSKGLPIVLGDYVTVGHNAVVHGARIGNGALIGMHACVLNGAEIGEGAMVAAGAVVKENMKVPAGALAVGVPARIVKDLTPEQQEAMRQNALHYAQLAQEYREEA